MLSIKFASQFKKDYKLAKRQGRNLDKLESTILKLREEEPLPESMHDHELIGNYGGHRECHLEPDWLLMYRIDHEALTLTAIRMGSHSDLFD